MAGLIAAHGFGPNGVLGIAPKAKILPVLADLNDDANGHKSLALGLRWAVSNGANVINVSAGGNPSAELQAAVESAIEADIVVVAASGNRPNRNVGFPAAYPGVVAVVATAADGDIASLSVEGKGISIAAPGVNMMTTRPAGQYAAGSGTSDSAAIVSGAVALVRSRFPELSAEEVVHRLTATAIDKGAPGRDEQYGYGVLNLMGALTADVPPLSGSPTVGVPSTAASDGVAAPETPRGGGLGLPGVVGALVVVGGLITAFVFRVRARRRADGAGPVP